MKYKRATLFVIAAWLFLPPLVFSSTSARAQGPASVASAPAIQSFDLDPPTRLVAGESLIFRLTGSPHARASVKIEGVNRNISLREAMPGIYEGAYTIRAGDRIDLDSVVTGNLRIGDREFKAILGQSLVETSAVAASD